MGAVFGLAALLSSALRIRRRFGGVDVALNAALVAAQILYLLAVEAGSIQQTMVRDRNWVLGRWLVTLAALVICVGIAGGTGMTASEPADTAAPL